MPLYEYECDACGRRFEVIQKFSDAPVEICRECGKGPVHKLLSSPAIQFKGSGWYITDYAQKGKSDTSSSAPAGKTGEAAKSDGASAAASTDAASSSTASPTPSSTTAETKKSDSGASASKSKSKD